MWCTKRERYCAFVEQLYDVYYYVWKFLNSMIVHSLSYKLFHVALANLFYSFCTCFTLTLALKFYSVHVEYVSCLTLYTVYDVLKGG